MGPRPMIRRVHLAAANLEAHEEIIEGCTSLTEVNGAPVAGWPFQAGLVRTTLAGQHLVPYAWRNFGIFAALFLSFAFFCGSRPLPRWLMIR